MNLTQRHINDLRYLRQLYGWDDVAATDVKLALRESGEPMAHYFSVLASAHRAGYEQHAGNGFQRLQSWCIEKGLPDPFGPEFDLAALDAMETRKAA